MAQEILASQGGCAAWAVRQGMEDALCTLAGYEARAERTQPWTVDRRPAEASEHQSHALSSAHSRSFVTALWGSGFRVCTELDELY